MTKLNQKEMEIGFAESAAKALGANWSISSSESEGEWPDLIISESGSTFGLEVREIYLDEGRKGSRKKAKERNNLKVVAEIAKEYYAKISIPIHVEFLGELKEKNSIIDNLVCRSRLLAELEECRFEPFFGCTIYMQRLPTSLSFYNRWLYITDRVGWAGKLTHEVVQDRVNEKSKKLESYRTNMSDVRLLLVLNRAYRSGMFKLPEKSSIDKLGFSKVYLVAIPDGDFIVYS